jgi:hypothetical protein
MNDGRRARLVTFTAASSAIIIAVGVIAAGAPHGRRTHRPAHRESRPPVGARSTPRPARTRGAPSVSPAQATIVARRFAVAWRAWDTGRRSRRVATELRRLCVAALWRQLRNQRDRPAVARPPASIVLRPVRAVASGGATWRAVLTARHPAESYLATAVIAATPAGPRVADIRR